MRIFRKRSKLFIQNKSYYPRDYYYNKLLNKYNNVESYLSLTRLHDKQALLTDKVISFSDHHDFKANKKKYFKKKYGKPNYSIVNVFPFGNIKIMFYRIKIGGLKTKLELHFFQNTLFMYNYTFSYLKNESEKNQIFNVLKEKYMIDKEKNLALDNCYIKDKNNTVIVLTNSVDFTINYIHNINSVLYQQMNDILTREIKRENQKIIQNEQNLYLRI